MNNREQVLVEREGTHGDYTEVSLTSQTLKENLRASDKWVHLSTVQQESLELICLKVARIIHGNPDEPDHWKDIAGYAKLVEERL